MTVKEFYRVSRSETPAYKNIFISLVFYLPTTAFVPAYLYYFLPFIFFFIGGENERRKDLITLFIAFLFISTFFNLLTLFLTSSDINYRDNFIPLQVSILFSLACSLYLNEKVARYIIVLVAFEILIGLIQYLLGIQSFFGATAGGNDSQLLYNNRVFGLSNNSSGLAGKALICLVLFEFYFSMRVKALFKLSFYLLVFIALIVSFSRSGLVAFSLYMIVLLLKNIKSIQSGIYLFVFTSLVLGVWSIYFDYSYLLEQFTRGRGDVDVSGRDIIWSEYIKVSLENAIFGNFGFRNYLNFDIYGEMHAHSTYLMSFYILGGVSFLLCLIPLLYIFLVRKAIFLILLPLFIYSLAQYFVFWGASLVDIVLLAVLFSFRQGSTEKHNDCT